MRRFVATAAVAIGLVLAGCGGGDDDTTSTPDGAAVPGAGTAPPGAGEFPPQFLDCMVDRGVDVSSSEAIHAPEAQEAFYACLPVLHGG